MIAEYWKRPVSHVLSAYRSVARWIALERQCFDLLEMDQALLIGAAATNFIDQGDMLSL